MKHHGKRLDYVLYRAPKSLSYLSPSPSLQCTSCEVVLHDNATDCKHSFSDHFGVEATFSVQANLMNEEGANSAQPATMEGVHSPSIEAALKAIMSYYPLAKKRASSYMSLFYLCIIVILGTIIGSAFLPKSSFDPIFVIIVAAVSWLATTSFYMGFIFGRWETRALMTVIDEMELIQERERRQSRNSTSSGSH